MSCVAEMGESIVIVKRDGAESRDGAREISRRET